LTAALLGATLLDMPLRSPKQRARRFLVWLAKQGAWTVTHDGHVLIDDNVESYLAELIADAQEDVRQGFLRGPTGREPHIHD